MIEALAEDGIKTLEDFAPCADWELAGGYTTTADGKRVKDTGLLEKFDMSLEEAQTLVMSARVQLGWVDAAELEAAAEESRGERRRRGGRRRGRPEGDGVGRGGRVKDRETPERRCIVTRETGPKAGLIRFVIGPDGEVTPDLAGKLPGRGLWVAADRATLEQGGGEGPLRPRGEGAGQGRPRSRRPGRGAARAPGRRA